MTVVYGIIEEKYIIDDTVRTSYGIAAYADPKEDGGATVISSAHDITTDKHKLSELISICNQQELSVIHLSDVIEDFIAE